MLQGVPDSNSRLSRHSTCSRVDGTLCFAVLEPACLRDHFIASCRIQVRSMSVFLFEYGDRCRGNDGGLCRGEQSLCRGEESRRSPAPSTMYIRNGEHVATKISEKYGASSRCRMSACDKRLHPSCRPR